MPNFKVSGGFCLEIEDVDSEEEAKKEAFDQLADCFRYYPWETALNVKAEKTE
jgi:hypothetical protein